MDMETHHPHLPPPFHHALHFYPSPISELPSSPFHLNGSKNGPSVRSLSLTSTATSGSADLSVSVPLTPASSDSPTDFPLQNPLHLAISGSLSSPNDQPVTVKRSRGRPRKHPVKLPDADLKVQKPRSKTGCLTCRKRKKKCDESKPTCMNCEKNGKQCEGYPPFEPWQRSQKSGDSTISKVSPGSTSGVESTFTLPFLNPASPSHDVASDKALETRLLDHFHSHLMHLLAPKVGEASKLRSIIETLALQSTPDGEGVRDCILALSAAHILVSFPHFDKPDAAQKYEEAHDQYYSKAMKRLISALNYHPGDAPDDFTIIQIMLMLLHTAIAGDKNGEYRIHLKAGLHLMTRPNTTADPTFRQLYASIFWFYGVISAVTVPSPLGDALSPANVMELGYNPQQSSYAGVPNEMLRMLLQVSVLRQNIRDRRKKNMSPLCDYPAVHTFHELSSALDHMSAMETLSPAGKITSRLYQSCTWVYLLHTINCSGTQTQNWKNKIEDALNSINELLATSTTQVVLFPLFVTGCCSSDPGHRDAIRNAFRQLQLVRSIANVELAGQVVEHVWSLNDSGDSQGWDWEGVMSDMGLDSLFI